MSVRWAPLNRRLRRQSAPFCGHRKQRRVKHVKIRRGCAFACRRGYRVIGDGTPVRPGYEVVQAPSLSPMGGVVGVYFMLRGLGDWESGETMGIRCLILARPLALKWAWWRK